MDTNPIWILTSKSHFIFLRLNVDFPYNWEIWEEFSVKVLSMWQRKTLQLTAVLSGSQANATGRWIPMYSTIKMNSCCQNLVIALNVPSTLPHLHIVKKPRSFKAVKTRTLSGRASLSSSSSSNVVSILGEAPRFDGLLWSASLSSDAALLEAPTLETPSIAMSHSKRWQKL